MKRWYVLVAAVVIPLAVYAVTKPSHHYFTGGTTHTGATSLRGAVAISGFVTNTGGLSVEVLTLPETTTPTAVPGSGKVYTKDDNKVYFQTGAGAEQELTMSETFHGEFSDADNTDAFGISAANNFECYHTNGLAGFELDGFTFDGGGEGTSFPIASIADGGAGEIAVTTTGTHGLAVGDIVSQANLTDTAYEGVFVVNTINSTTIYEVTATYTADDTGTMNQCASLIVSSGSAGTYLALWSASATTATNNETFDMELFIEATAYHTTEIRRKFGTATDYGNMGSHAIIALSDGDHISFVIENQDTAGDLTIRYITLVLMRL